MKIFYNSIPIHYNKAMCNEFSARYSMKYFALSFFDNSAAAQNHGVWAAKKTYSVHIRFFYGSCRTASSAKSEILPHLPYAGLLPRAAFPPQADAAAGMRVTEVRKAGWHIEHRSEIADIYDTRYAYPADALGTEGMLDNNFRLRKRRSCTWIWADKPDYKGADWKENDTKAACLKNRNTTVQHCPIGMRI